jgi:hypothetical protein
MQRHLIHLICGSTGAAKTTYALQLAAELGAIRFLIDEWMAALFWMDSPHPLVPLGRWSASSAVVLKFGAWRDKSLHAVFRVCSIWALARQGVARGSPSSPEMPSYRFNCT